jgi:hypothetical protein
MIFGPIIVCGDYKGNLQSIVSVLNQWRFDAVGVIKFEVYGDIIVSTCLGYNPLACPRQPKEDLYAEPESISREAISRNISPLLESGTLELVSVDHDDDWNARIVRVTIHANGSVEGYTQFLHQQLHTFQRQRDSIGLACNRNNGD